MEYFSDANRAQCMIGCLGWRKQFLVEVIDVWCLEA